MFSLPLEGVLISPMAQTIGFAVRFELAGSPMSLVGEWGALELLLRQVVDVVDLNNSFCFLEIVFSGQ